MSFFVWMPCKPWLVNSSFCILIARQIYCRPRSNSSSEHTNYYVKNLIFGLDHNVYFFLHTHLKWRTKNKRWKGTPFFVAITALSLFILCLFFLEVEKMREKQSNCDKKCTEFHIIKIKSFGIKIYIEPFS